MIAIDASTLILLSKVELLDTFLDSVGMGVFISKRDEREATVKESFDAKLIESRIKEGKILVKGIKNRGLVRRIEKDFGLHAGEAETIALCIENGFKLIVTDDYRAMKACAILKIPFVSAIGILVKLYKKNELNRREALAALEGLYHYGRYSEEIIKEVKKEIGG